MFGTFLAVLLIVPVSQCPKVGKCAVPPHRASFQWVHWSLRRAGTAATPAFPICCPLLPPCEWWLDHPVRLCLQPQPHQMPTSGIRSNAKLSPDFVYPWDRKAWVCTVPCPVWCFLPPRWKGPQQLRCNFRTFPAGPSGSLPHHRPSASGSPSSQGKPGALTCLKHFGLPRTPSSAPVEINKTWSHLILDRD